MTTSAPARRSILRPVAMLTHSYYEEDPRVRREAEALVAAGRPVDVFALRRPGDPGRGVLDGVAVTRLDVHRHQGAGIGTYLTEYVSFFTRVGWALTTAHRSRRYSLIQVHTLPDFLVLAGLPLRIAGHVPLVLDLHEAMPEFFRSRFPRAHSPLAHRALLVQERLAVGVADAVLTVNESLADRLVSLGTSRRRVTVIPNSPALQRFDPSAHDRRPFMADGILRVVYAGALTPTYELSVVLDGLAHVAGRRPDVRFVLDLYGRGDSEPVLRDQAIRLGLADRVVFHGRIPIEDVPAALARADLGVAPTRRDEFTDFSLSTKIFEYGAMEKPVVATRLPLVERTFPDGTVMTYAAGDAGAFATALESLVDDAPAREARIARTAECVREHAWEREGQRYVDLVERLALDGRSSADRVPAGHAASPREAPRPVAPPPRSSSEDT